MNKIEDVKHLTLYLTLGNCLFTGLQCSYTHFYLSKMATQRGIQVLGFMRLSYEEATTRWKRQTFRKLFDLGYFPT